MQYIVWDSPHTKGRLLTRIAAALRAAPNRSARSANRIGLSAVLLALFALMPKSTLAQDSRKAGLPQTDSTQERFAGSPAVSGATDTARRIRALIAGDLDVADDAAVLFDVDLNDEPSVRIAALRLRALIGESHEKRPKTARKNLAPEDSMVWEARLDLDRARLAFYELPADRRKNIIEAHRQRRAEVARRHQLDQAQHVRTAAEERQLALAAVERAKTEAARAVAGELARLSDVENRLATFDRQLEKERQSLISRRQAVLGWQQRALEAHKNRSIADATYDALRAELRSASAKLASVLGAGGAGLPQFPEVGPDPLVELPPNIDAAEARAKRSQLEADARRLQAAAQAFTVDQADVLLDEIDTLNRERLTLLPYLSPAKQHAVTGFTAAGWDQARAEMRHLILIIRYHRHVVIDWVASLRKPGGPFRGAIARTAASVVPLMFVLGLFFWWRRRNPRLLSSFENRLEESDHLARLAGPSLALRGFRFLRAIHQPLEWLLLFLALSALMPSSFDDLFEIRLINVVVGWTLAGMLVVHAINAAFVFSPAARRPGNAGTNELRLRSLRLVGRVVVAIVLVLVITSRLVGEGTIYSWVWSIRWPAAIIVFLLLMRWWSDTVFSRIKRARKKNRFQQWVLANQAGWFRFVAATAAGVYLFAGGTLRIARNWISSFEFVRRGHAYLFRREISKRERERPAFDLSALDAGLVEQLGPEINPGPWISNGIEEALADLAARMQSGSGGVIAVVGERGSGKTTSLKHLCELIPSAIYIDCSQAASVDALLGRAPEGASLPAAGGLETVGRNNDVAGAAPVLLDNAQAFIRPIMGGLKALDELIAIARLNNKHTTWLLAVDTAVWPFLESARGTRPLFDDVITLGPWPEQAIDALLHARCKQAGIEPSFQDLLNELPSDADEIDRFEALDARRAAYSRLIWDYSDGNPGVALHAWRQSLARTSSGEIHVRPLQAPNGNELEKLPDASLFVLRAILQLSPARIDDIVEATQLSQTQIRDALRYGAGHGFLKDEGGVIMLTWTWYRPITRVLERRHLLVRA